MHTNITRTVATLALIALVAPAAASAQSATDIQGQIKGLMDQIKALQTQLIALRASSTPPAMPHWTEGNASTTRPGMMGPKQKMCLNVYRNLRMGDRGDDVRELQEMLRGDSSLGFNASSTGLFGPMTMKAMAKWQMKNGIASSTDGSVGPRTRAFFKDCGVDNQGGTAGPSALRSIGEKLRDFFGIGDEDKRGQAAGTVKTVTGMTFTLERPNSELRTVNVTSSTTIKVVTASSSMPVAGTIADIAVGKLVHAEGTVNNDGSLTAIMVKVGLVRP